MDKIKIKRLEEILSLARLRGASDIHISVGLPPAFRIDGYMERLEEYEGITCNEVNSIIEELGGDSLENLEKGFDTDASFQDIQRNRYRVNVYKQRGTPSVAIRLLNDKIPSMEELGLPGIIKDLATVPRGLVLITGPTGSGKSTTLAAMIDYINENKRKHILTIEDPIEYMHTSKVSLVNQREVGVDVSGFYDGMRSALREDPDVIMIGELRDYETISLAITLAETGHTVFGTLHTIGAADTINRMVDAFPSEQQNQVSSQLSSSLQAVISQILIPRLEGGRIAVHEILTVNDAVSNNIKSRSVHRIKQTQQTSKALGMTMLDDELATLVNRGVISKSVALEYVKDVSEFEIKLKSKVGMR